MVSMNLQRMSPTMFPLLLFLHNDPLHVVEEPLLLPNRSRSQLTPLCDLGLPAKSRVITLVQTNLGTAIST